MTKQTKTSLMIGVVLLLMMLLQLYSISFTQKNEMEFQNTKYNNLTENLSHDGLTDSQARTIADAIRAEGLAANYSMRLDSSQQAFFTTMSCLLVSMILIGKIKKDEN